MNWYDRYVYWRLGPAARLVCHAFENPDTWDSDTYTIKHKPSGLVFWVSNGASHFKLYRPQEIDCFSRFERRVLWAKYEKWKTMLLFTKMAGLS